MSPFLEIFRYCYKQYQQELPVLSFLLGSARWLHDLYHVYLRWFLLMCQQGLPGQEREEQTDLIIWSINLWRDAQGLEIAGANMAKLQTQVLTPRHSLPLLGDAGGLTVQPLFDCPSAICIKKTRPILPILPILPIRKFRPVPVWHERLHVSSKEPWLLWQPYLSFGWGPGPTYCPASGVNASFPKATYHIVYIYIHTYIYTIIHTKT